MFICYSDTISIIDDDDDDNDDCSHDHDDKSQASPHTNKQTGRSCSSSVSCLPDFSLEATRYTWSYTRSFYPSYCYLAASIAAVQWGLELLDEVQDTMMIRPPLLLMMMMM